MDNLPLELQFHIIEFACDDDGYTALSLALVSRRFNQTSEYYRYQSVSAAGTHALTRCADVLENLPIHRRRVRNLFLSDLTRAEAPGSIENLVTRNRRDATVSAVSRIFNVVAPTLETLACMMFMSGSHPIVRHLYRLPLPHLRQLSLHGYFPYPTTSPNLLPRLERLRICGYHDLYPLLHVGESLAVACPRLHEVRFSGIVSSARFAQELERALFPDEAEKQWAASPTLPCTVRTIIAGIGHGPMESTVAINPHQMMKECFTRLAERTSQPGYVGARVLCVEECGERARYEEWRGSWGI